MNNIPVKTKIGYQQLFKISLMKEVIKPTKPHKHNDYFEVIILNKGAGFHSIDSVQYEVLPPVVYFLKPGQVHCWNFTKIPKGYVILFMEELIRQLNGTKGKLYDLPSQIKLNNEGNLWGLLNQLLAEDKAGPLRHEILRSYLDILLIKIFDGSKDQPKKRQTPDLIYQFKKLIDARNIHLKKVSEYAENLNISPAKLNAVCKKTLGKNAHDLIKEKVLMEAKNLLVYTNKTISEIAFELGFSDPSHFVKFFKSQTNLTPGKYRSMSVG